MTRFGSMFTTMHWLPKRRAAWRTNSGSRQAAELIDTLSHPAFKQGANVFHRANSASDRQRHEDHFGRAADHVEDDLTPLVAGGDVEEHQLVGPFLFVPCRNLDRIPGIAEIEEVCSLDHPAPAYVEAWNHPLRKHYVYCNSGSTPGQHPRDRGTGK